ncbi:hypothetical protein AKO1_014239 [Acrasis kona]|uniref:Class II aldolase/adducin N-terminal domain-containing protein n=1 Tax=Acrasis kona TaxID=1008807 RepID=A0AAW2Z2G0_9EUKA
MAIRLRVEHSNHKLVCCVDPESTISDAISSIFKRFNDSHMNGTENHNLVLATSDGEFQYKNEDKVSDVLGENSSVSLISKQKLVDHSKQLTTAVIKQGDVEQDQPTFDPSDYVPAEGFSTRNIRSILSKTLLPNYSIEEQKRRIELAACYRLFDLFDWTDTIYGHLTARANTSEHNFLINAFGLLYSEITASSLVKVSLEGDIIDSGVTGDLFGINKAGYVIHSAIHESRPDVTCVMHCHFRDAAGVSCTKDGLDIDLSQTAQTVGPIVYHDYEGIAVNEEEKKRLVKDLGDANVMILKNHGILTCGKTVSQAFMLMNQLIEACRIQTKAYSNLKHGHESIVQPDKKAAEFSRMIAQKMNPQGVGVKELSAYMRLLDAKDSSFRL